MNKKWITISVLLISLIGFGGFWYYTKNSSAHDMVSLGNGFEMRTCLTDEEKDFVRKQFKENWAILIATPSYDIEYFLNKRGTYPFQTEYEGKMHIKVLYKDGVKVGFCSYYMKTPIEGAILFIDVDKDYRGKRYAEELMRYATADLKRLGAHYIRFSTLADNFSAQKVYDRLGYERINGDPGRVWYRLNF